MDKLLIYGASGHGKVVLQVANELGFECSGFIDDDESKSSFAGLSVHRTSILASHSDTAIFIGIGSNDIRKSIAKKFPESNYAKLVSNYAVVGPDVNINQGTIVMPGSVINDGTTIGAHVVINTSASIDHDCVIGDFVHVAPNGTLCGDVHVGEGSFIGAGATIIPGVRVGRNCIIGAGSTVLRDVLDNTTVVGNPARSLS
ncbi:MAG: acetyltransferase [Flavobacteriia bacterium]|nr:acetyltransferase [Flavobacteriia bacterium]